MFSNKVIGQISPNELIIISLTYYLGKTKKIIYPSELFFFSYVSLSERKKITSSFGVYYFLPLPLFASQK